MTSNDEDIDFDPKQRVVMAVGPNGVGKSTLLNILATGGVTDPGHGFQPGGGTDSVTLDIVVKRFGNTLFVDTPGLGDRNGKDTQNIAMMAKELRDLKRMHLFLLVLKGPDQRINTHTRDVIDVFAACFGNGFLSNAALVFTHWPRDERSLTRLANQGRSEEGHAAAFNKYIREAFDMESLELPCFFLDSADFEEDPGLYASQIASIMDLAQRLDPYDCRDARDVMMERDQALAALEEAQKQRDEEAEAARLAQQQREEADRRAQQAAARAQQEAAFANLAQKQREEAEKRADQEAAAARLAQQQKEEANTRARQAAEAARIAKQKMEEADNRAQQEAEAARLAKQAKEKAERRAAEQAEIARLEAYRSARLAQQQKEADRRAAPASYICPLVHEIMKDPVLTLAGSTYERKIIEEWLKTNTTDPLTNEDLSGPKKKLIPNRALRDSIQQWRKEYHQKQHSKKTDDEEEEEEEEDSKPLVNPFAIDRTNVKEGPDTHEGPDVLSEIPPVQDKPTGTAPKIVNADAVNLFPEKDGKQDGAPERRSALDGTPAKKKATTNGGGSSSNTVTPSPPTTPSRPPVAAAAATATSPAAASNDLQEGEERTVQGKSTNTTYTVKLLRGVYSCSCPAWRYFAGGPIDNRSCKHLRQVRGEEAEQLRLNPGAAAAARKRKQEQLRLNPGAAAARKRKQPEPVQAQAMARGAAAPLAQRQKEEAVRRAAEQAETARLASRPWKRHVVDVPGQVLSSKARHLCKMSFIFLVRDCNRVKEWKQFLASYVGIPVEEMGKIDFPYGEGGVQRTNDCMDYCTTGRRGGGDLVYNHYRFGYLKREG